VSLFRPVDNSGDLSPDVLDRLIGDALGALPAEPDVPAAPAAPVASGASPGDVVPAAQGSDSGSADSALGADGGASSTVRADSAGGADADSLEAVLAFEVPTAPFSAIGQPSGAEQLGIVMDLRDLVALWRMWDEASPAPREPAASEYILPPPPHLPPPPAPPPPAA